MVKSMKKSITVIKIKKEDLPKRRTGIQRTKKHRSKVDYRRKSKHPKGLL